MIESRFTIMTTVMIATITAVMMMFFVFEKQFKPLTEMAQVERLEVAIEKIEQLSNLEKQITDLEAKNTELVEMMEFYKEKNEFLNSKLENQNLENRN